jgi:cation diffusion facilitator family transporter
MDCPSEEQMIRMKLEGIDAVEGLEFDIPGRKLFVFHRDNPDRFKQKIFDLDLDASLSETIVVDNYKADLEAENTQRKVLWTVLAINFSFFVIEMVYGWISGSMGLVADSLDMLADSVVYGLSLFAVGAALSRKKRIAKMSGYFQMLLAALGLIEVVRRFFGFEEIPVFQTMIIVSSLALIANSYSLYLIQKARSTEAHMQASMIFTSNDIIINAGVIIAGVLVYFTQSKYPDLVIGFIIFLIVIRGALRILRLAKD